MLTRKIDQALEAMDECARRVPDLRNIFRPGSPRDIALGRVMEALEEAERVLSGKFAPAPAQSEVSAKVREGA